MYLRMLENKVEKMCRMNEVDFRRNRPEIQKKKIAIVEHSHDWCMLVMCGCIDIAKSSIRRPIDETHN